MLSERQLKDRQFHVDIARETVKHLDPSLDVDQLIARLVLSTKALQRGEEASLEVGKKLDNNLSRAIVTLIFAALEGSYMVRTNSEEPSTQFVVVKM